MKSVCVSIYFIIDLEDKNTTEQQADEKERFCQSLNFLVGNS